MKLLVRSVQRFGFETQRNNMCEYNDKCLRILGTETGISTITMIIWL